MSTVDRDVLAQSFTHAEQALDRLEEVIALQTEHEDIKRDATIQRFEICYERLWKLFRKIHMLRGVDPKKVRRAFEVFVEAGAAGWLKHREHWEQMIEDRNFTSHEYSENTAAAIYTRIVGNYATEMRAAFVYVKHHYYDQSPFEEWNDRA